MFGEQQRFVLLLIAPAALLLLLFQVVPIVIGANASFRDWALYNPKKTWIGFDHYVAVISDPAFLYVVLPNTFFFMFASVALSLVAGLALALALNRPFRAQKLVQTVLLLAGLQSLPREPFEAAAIDGTSTWRVFTHLTLPMLRSVIVVCVVIRAIDAFRTFDIVWTLTGGGPGRSTELFRLYAYVLAFLNLDLGRGSAAAIIGGLIILVLGVVMYRLVDRIAKA
jgi:ABC-type sugar transport system permease subunit